MRKNGKPFDRTAFMTVGEDTNRDRSEEQERRIASDTGGVKRRGSGSVQGRKGDVRNVPVPSIPGTLLIEAKTTKHKSRSLKLSELRKIEREADSAGFRGAMIISFEDAHDYLVIRKDYVDFKGEETP